MIQKVKNMVSTDTGRDTVIVSIGTAVNAIAGGLFFIFAPRILGPEQYGLFATVIATSVLITSISNFGIDTGILKFANINTDQFNKTLTIALKSYLFLGFTIAALGIIISPLIAQFLSQPEITILLRIAFIGNIFILLTNFYVAGLQAGKDFFRASLVNIIANIARLVLLVLSVYFYTVGLYQLTIIFFLSTIVSVVVGKMLLQFKHQESSKENILKFHQYNMWIALSLIISSIPFDNYILLKISGPAQAGLYAAPFKILTFAHQIGGNFSRVLAPRLISFDTKSKVLIYSKKSLSVIIVFILGLLFLALFSSQLINLLFGSDFIPSVEIFRILSFGFILFIASIIPSSIILYYLGKSKISFYITILKYFMFAISLSYFVPKLGALGAANSFVIAEALSLILMSSYAFYKIIISTDDKA